MARSNNNNKLKAFVRFDGSGRVVSSSLIVQAFKPKVGNWKEIDAKECCNYTSTTTTTAIPLVAEGSFLITVEPCVGGGPTVFLNLYMIQGCVDLIAPGCQIYTDAAGTITPTEGYYVSWIRGIDYFYIGPDGIVVNVDVCPQP